MLETTDLWRDCEGKRPVIIHNHIYKNAGSTIDSVLEREFGTFFSTLHRPEAGAAISNERLLEYLQQHPSLLALSSHQLRYPKPVSDQIEFFDFCFLRHPLDRLYSQYSFLRKPGVEDPLTGIASITDLGQFLGFLLEHHPEYACNPQTSLLLHQGDRPSSETDLDAMKDLLREIALLGVVEQFDESLTIAEYLLHPCFPRLQLHYSPQNVTNREQMTFEHRLEVIRSSCSPHLYARLIEANRLDLALWQDAREEVERRLLERPDHSLWLEEFRRRTARYQGGPRLRDKLLRRVRLPPAIAQHIARE